MKKPTAIWVQFGSCSGCTISFLDNRERSEEMLDRYIFSYIPLIQDNPSIPDACDLAIVEGAIAVTKQHLKLLHIIRKRAKKVLALGACAENSGILHYAIGNQMPQPELDAFLPVHEIIDVDYVMPGCPPAPEAILKVLRALLENDYDYLRPYNAIIGKSEGRIRDVVQQGLCMSCGMCGATCPTNAISYVEGKPVIRDERCIMCGECYFQCPRAFFPCTNPSYVTCDPDMLQPMGCYLDHHVLRAKDSSLRKHAQAGGVVSALLSCALDQKDIDGALVAEDGPNPWEGIPAIISSSDQVPHSAGTKYSVCPVLSLLKDAFTSKGHRKIAIVGLACQMESLNKFDSYPLGIRIPTDASLLKIGLFCSSNFRYNAMHKMVEEVGGVRPHDIARIDIGEGSFNITSITGEKISIPLQVVHHYEQESCKVCPDFTAEFSDISIGAIGAPKGWSSVIVRSEQGSNLLKKALDLGYIEQKDGLELNVGLVEDFSKRKRKKANDALEWRKKYGLHIPFAL